MKKLILLWVFLGSFTHLAFGEILHLKDGRKIEGTVIQKTPQEVKINVQGITVTYFNDEIDRVEGSSAPTSAVSPVSPAVPAEKAGLPKMPATLTPLPSSGLSSLASTSSAGPPEDKKGLILSLIEASGARDNMNQMYAQLLGQYPVEEAEKLKKVFDVNEIILELVPVYEKYFNEAELKELIAFYRSPVGFKLLKATPLIMQDSINASLLYFQRKIQAAGLEMSPEPAGSPAEPAQP